MRSDSCDARRIGRAVDGHELTSHHEARTPDVTDRRMLASQRRQTGPQLLTPGVDVLHETRGGEHVDRREGGCASHRVPAVGPAVRSERPAVHDRGRRTDRGDRKPRCNTFGHHHDVGRYTHRIDREHRTRAAESRLHLIGHVQDSVLEAARLDALRKRSRRRHVPAFAEHRFHDNGRGLTGRGLRRQ